MAEFGAKYPCFKSSATGVTSGAVIGKLVKANLTVNLASGELWADDGLAEYLADFGSGDIDMETDDLTDANASTIYGCTVSDGLVTYKQGDTPPLGKLAYYKVLMRNGARLFRGYYYPKVRAALGSDNAETRGSSITFQTAKTKFKVFAEEDGTWRQTKEFDTEAAAKTWVQTQCSISA